MKDKIFVRILALIMILGTISTFALGFYTYHLQKESSLTAFIANEGEK